MSLFELDNPLQHLPTEQVYVEAIQLIQDVFEKRTFLTVDNFRAIEQLLQPLHTKVCLYLGEMYRRGLYADDAGLRTIFDTTSISCYACKEMGEVTDMSDFRLKGVSPVIHNQATPGEDSGCRVLCTKCMGKEKMRPLTEAMLLRLWAGKYQVMLYTLWTLLPQLKAKLEMIQFVKKTMIQKARDPKEVSVLMDQIADLPGFKPTLYKEVLTPEQWRAVRMEDFEGIDLDDLIRTLRTVLSETVSSDTV